MRIGSLDGYAGTIAGWGSAFGTDGDLLIYGCDLASNSRGEMLVESISALTGADVAASTDDTGSALFGGDWELEYSVGPIETDVVFSSEVQQDWDSLLAVATVDTTADVVDGNTSSITNLIASKGADGFISLREAITAANNTTGLDEIQFNIADDDPGHFYYADDSTPGALLSLATTTLSDGMIGDFDPDYPYVQHSWFRIDLNNALPQLSITDTVIINGFTQPGATQNTLSIGNDANLRIELTSSGGDSNRGLTVQSGGSGSSIFGLVVNGFDFSGILTESGADNVTLQGNFVGTDVTGTIDLGNGDDGIHLRSGGNLVGGPNVADRNVLSGNASRGLSTFTTGAIRTGNVVQNNYIGVDATGVRALGNSTAGVQIYNNDGLQLLDNVIAANTGDGVWLRNSTSVINTVIHGNLIGVAADGATALGNTAAGIWIEEATANTTIGGLLAGQGNTIAHNTTDGVMVSAGTSTSIRGNSIFNNGGLAIDLLGVNGVNNNDPGDIDNGPNYLLNYPVITSATVAGTNLTVVGTFNTLPFLNCNLDFYWSPVADLSSHGEAQTYIGTANVTPDIFGNASFNTMFAGVSVPVGAFVTATATEFLGNTSEFALNATAVLAPNSAPVINSNGGGATAALNVAENSTVVTTVTATDADLPPETLTYSIFGGSDAGQFTINSSTGELTFATIPDFETPTDIGTDNVYDVTVQVSDGTLIDTQDISVTVVDSTVLDEFNAVSYSGNDGPSNWVTDWQEIGETQDSSGGRIRVVGNRLRMGGDEVNMNGRGIYREANFAGATTATLTFSYQRQRLDDPGGSVTLEISNNGGSSWTSLTTYNLQGTDATPIDEEFDVTAFISSNMQVRFLGAGSDVSSYFFVDNVQFTDAPVSNNAPVITSNGGGSSTAINVAENTTVITTVTASDSDADTTTFAITGGADAARFSINAITGDLTFITARDFETPADTDLDNDYEVEVQADDGNGRIDAQLISVTVTNVNEAPTITSNGGGTSTAVNVAENSSGVTTVTANDADLPGDTLTYTISGGADAAKFAINSSTGVLTFAVAPDFETPTDNGTDNVYDVTVQVSDGTLTDTQAISVTVTSLNDNTPTITSDGGGATAAVNVSENTTAVTTVTATDADLPGDTLTYSISGGADQALFNIDSGSGALTFASAPDFETPIDANTDNVYAVTVQVSDGLGGTDTQDFSVSVTAQNDNSPTTTSNGGGATAAVNVAENTTAVTTVTATDADLPAQTLTYSISGGADAAKFAINSSTGVLTFATAPDSEAPTDVGTDNVYDVTVQVSDGSLTDTQAIAVSVTPVNDNIPTITAAQVFVVPESTTKGTSLGTVTATDADAGATFSNWTITGGNSDGIFAINSGTGVLTVADNSNLDFETTTSYVLSLTVSDGTNTSSIETLSISVTNANDNAPVSAPDSYSVDQGATLSVASLAGVLANDSDADGSPLIALLVSGTANGSLMLQSDGSFVYTPDTSFSGVDSFVYQPFDGNTVGTARTVELNVVVNAVVPPPAEAVTTTETTQDDADSDVESETESAADEAAPETTVTATTSTQHNDSGSEQGTAVPSSPDSSDDEGDELFAAGISPEADSSTAFFDGQSERMELREAGRARNSSTAGEMSAGSSIEVNVRFGNSLRFDSEDLSYLVGTGFIQELEQVEDEFDFEAAIPEWAAGSAVATSASISVGYIMWMLRGGYVLASVMSTLPVWQHIDPLPVLAALDAVDAEDDESLESMIDSASEKSDDSETVPGDGTHSENTREEISV